MITSSQGTPATASLIQDSTVSGSSQNNFVTGNFIGTNAAGAAAVANGGSGVKLDGSNGNTIGGTGPTEGNVISGNGGEGVELTNGAQTNTVQGNFIGVGADGTTAIGNTGNGVEIYVNGSSGNTIGVPNSASITAIGNRFAGKTQSSAPTQAARKSSAGANKSAASTSTAVRRSAGRSSGAPSKTNQSGGNRFAPFAPPPTVGNTTGANIIANNGQDGVRVTNPGDINNLISQNSIYSNTLLGINLGADGVTPNNSLLHAGGPNLYQNFPEIQVAAADTQTISGTLDVTSGTPTFTIEFFNNGSQGCDGTNGEGKTYIGSASTIDGSFTSGQLPLGSFVAGDVITATATDFNGNTSEFSVCFTATASASATTSDLSITKSAPATVTEGNNFTYTIIVSNSNSATATATGVSVTDILPAGVTFVSASPGCTGTSTVTCSGSDIPAGGSDTFTIVVTAGAPTTVSNTASATASNDPNSPHTSNAAMTTINGASCTPSPTGMVAWLPADGNPDDITAHGNNGTLVGGATFAPGKVDQAFSLDGSSQYVSIADNGTMQTPAFTVDTWVNFSSLVNGAVVASKYDGNWHGWILQYFDTGNFQFQVEQTTNVQGAASGSIGPIAPNSWVHVAGTYDGTNITLYINGSVAGTGTLAGGYTPTATPLTIGKASWADQNYLAGKVDEFEFFDRALNGTEIGNIYNASFAGKCRTCTTPPTGMVSWWPAENNANDIAGPNNGTPENGVTFVPGKVGKAFSLNGTNQDILIGNPASLQLQNFTLDAWVKRASASVASLNEPGGPGGLIFTYGNGGYGYGLLDDGTIFLSHIGVDGVGTTGLKVTDTSFHHVAVTKSGTAVTFYLDGVAESVTYTANPTFTFTSNAYLGQTGTNTFYGLLDEVEVFSTVLSAGDISNIYHAGNGGKCHSCTPAPSNMVSWYSAENNANDIQGANNGTPSGGVSFGPGKVGQAFSFDGFSGQVEIPRSIQDDFTIDFWVKSTQVAFSEGAWFDGAGLVDGEVLDVRDDFGVSLGQGKVMFGVGNPDTTIKSGFVADGNWHHVAATRVKATGAMILYIDGAQVATGTGNMNSLTSPPRLTMGREQRNIDPNYFAGQLDEVEIFNRALTATEIAAIADAGNAGKCHTSTIQFDSATYSVNEGNVNKTITVTRTGAHDTSATVHYATSDGPNTLAGRDYTNTFGDLSFAIGETSKTFDVPILQDNSFSHDTTVNLTLSSAGTGAVARSPIRPTIHDTNGGFFDHASGPHNEGDAGTTDFDLRIADNEHPTPTLSITSAVMHPEGDSGTTDFVFTVTKTGATDLTTTVNFATANGTTNPATGGAACGTVGVDYETQSGPLSFAPNETTKDITIKVCGDTTVEPDETFFVNLTGAGNATISNAQGVGTIQNDDQDVTVAVSPAAVLEDGATASALTV